MTVQDLLRQAVDQEIALWGILGEIEMELGVEIGDLDSTISQMAVSCECAADIPEESLNELIEEWVDRRENNV